MKRFCVFVTILMTASDSAYCAREIVWTASGTVSSAASAFSVPVDSPVEIRLSYQSQALTNIQTFLTFGNGVFYMKTDFYGRVGLLTEVRIGTRVWQGWLASGPGSLATEAWDGGGASDLFKVTVTSANGGVFGLFPYGGDQTARSIQFQFTDDVVPAAFIMGGSLPDETAVPQQISNASGTVSAGPDRISFTINPASIAVSAGPERNSLTISHTLGGITLGWPSVVGTDYRLEEGDLLGSWQDMGSYPGTGENIVVPLNPFSTQPARRFYRVASPKPAG